MNRLWQRVYFHLNEVYKVNTCILINTFNAFYLNLDSITNSDSIHQLPSLLNRQYLSLLDRIKQNIAYLLPVVFLICNHVDSFVIFVRANFEYSNDGMQDLLSRKIAPKELELQSDGVINTGITIELCVYALLLLKPGFEQKFKIYAIGHGDKTRIFSNGRFWSNDCAEKVIKFRKRARLVIGVCIWCGMSLCCFNWTWNAYWNSTGTLRDVLIIAYQPVFGFISNFGVTCVPFFIALLIHYFQIRQAYLVSQIEAFASGLAKKRPSASDAFIWRRYCQINRDILRLNIELRACSAHWSVYLTVFFGGYITMVTFLLYGMIVHTENLNIFHKSFFIFYTFECVAQMLLLTRECALIVRNNIKIFKANRSFCYVYSQIGQQNARCLLMMSKTIANFKGVKSGFKLINNFLIDSKMFEIILFYMGSMYMAIMATKAKLLAKPPLCSGLLSLEKVPFWCVIE